MPLHPLYTDEHSNASCVSQRDCSDSRHPAIVTSVCPDPPAVARVRGPVKCGTVRPNSGFLASENLVVALKGPYESDCHSVNVAEMMAVRNAVASR